MFMGGMAAGSALWGQVAGWMGISAALTIAAIGALIGVVVTLRFRIGQHDTVDLSPSLYFPSPTTAEGFVRDRGPVMVTVEYLIDPARLHEFKKVIYKLRRVRRRDGAFMWEMFSDIEQPNRIVECFMVESWLEHLRQHERITVADQLLIESVRAFHIGHDRPKVTHLVA